MLNTEKQINILLIEDNLGDVRLTQEAFLECAPGINLEVTMDGEEALQYLRRENGFAEKPLPHLILLDLNLPKWDGTEILRIVKNDVSLRHIPVIVLTTSMAEQDIRKCYDLHANCYLHKPVNFDQFFELIKSIEIFWLSTVVLPPVHHL